jgi:hypothetical protein
MAGQHQCRAHNYKFHHQGIEVDDAFEIAEQTEA